MNILTALFGGRYSLKRNLVVNIVLAYCFCFALATGILIYEFNEALRTDIEDALMQEVREVAGQIDPGKPDYGLNPQALRIRGNSGTYRYTVFGADLGLRLGGETPEDIVSQLASLVPDTPEIISMPVGRVGVALRGQVQQQDFYVLASTNAPGPDKTGFFALANEFGEELQWVLAGIVAILMAALLATRRALRPLGRISEQANDIDLNATSRRLKTNKMPKEIIPLVDAVNGAFDRLEQGYRAQRDFSSNVAHEVRTPLAVLQSSIELIEDSELKADLKQDVSHLDQLFEQLIGLSRAEALGPASFESVNLSEIATSLAIDIAPQTVRDGKALAITGAEQSQVMGHTGLLSIALDNLVRNALTYSPKGCEIEIEVLANPAGWKVYDCGPGVPDALKQGLFERFNRGATSNQHIAGSGIGLAIVQSVADAHGARVSITDRPGGGSIFTFEFNG